MSRKETVLVKPDQLTFEKRIKEVQIGRCRLLMLKTEVKNIISWQGSFVSNPAFAAGEELTQAMVVSLLDKGTKKRDKFEVADVLENRGAEVRFHQRGLRIGFSGQSLSDDFSDVFGVFAEQLFMPQMAEDEFEKSRMRIAASIQRNLEQTSSQANVALSQLIYAQAHPNYTFSAEDELQKLQEVDVPALHDYHTAHFGANDCIIVVVGDLNEKQVEDTVARHMGQWEGSSIAPAYDTTYELRQPNTAHVPMQDKFNLDVKLGHRINIRRQDPDFTALHMGNYILGGNFSSRLMDIVRDEMGLTYGVYSGLSGISREHDGHWHISITLSQDKLDQGIEATRNVVTQFVRKGVSKDEVDEKKTTITGTYILKYRWGLRTVLPD